MKHLLLTLALLLSCGAADNKSAPAQDRPERYAELQQKRDLYYQLTQDLQDDNGWFTDDCDSLLWNSLGVVAGLTIDIYAARDTDGKWFRTPGKACYAEGRSKSTISKDMLLGLAWALFSHGDSGSMADVLRYGRDRAYIMGEGPLRHEARLTALESA